MTVIVVAGETPVVIIIQCSHKSGILQQSMGSYTYLGMWLLPDNQTNIRNCELPNLLPITSVKVHTMWTSCEIRSACMSITMGTDIAAVYMHTLMAIYLNQ